MHILQLYNDKPQNLTDLRISAAGSLCTTVTQWSGRREYISTCFKVLNSFYNLQPCIIICVVKPCFQFIN